MHRWQQRRPQGDESDDQVEFFFRFCGILVDLLQLFPETETDTWQSGSALYKAVKAQAAQQMDTSTKVIFDFERLPRILIKLPIDYFIFGFLHGSGYPRGFVRTE